MRLFNDLQVYKIQHILGKSRFSGGLATIIELEDRYGTLDRCDKPRISLRFYGDGRFITFRIHDFPDITVDGSFVTGAAVTAILILAGVNPFLALFCSFLAGPAPV